MSTLADMTDHITQMVDDAGHDIFDALNSDTIRCEQLYALIYAQHTLIRRLVGAIERMEGDEATTGSDSGRA